MLIIQELIFLKMRRPPIKAVSRPTAAASRGGLNMLITHGLRNVNESAGCVRDEITSAARLEETDDRREEAAVV